MRRALALLAVGAVAGATVALAGVASGGTIRGPQTLRFVGRQDQFQAVDQPPHGASLGDQTFSSAILNRNGAVAGSLDLTCGLTHTASSAGDRYTCLGNARLSRGQVTLTGTIPTGSLESSSRFAITGGTEDFANVRGQAVNKTLSSTSSKLTLYLRP